MVVNSWTITQNEEVERLEHELANEKEKTRQLEGDISILIKGRNAEISKLNDTIVSLQNKLKLKEGFINQSPTQKNDYVNTHKLDESKNCLPSTDTKELATQSDLAIIESDKTSIISTSSNFSFLHEYITVDETSCGDDSIHNSTTITEVVAGSIVNSSSPTFQNQLCEYRERKESHARNKFVSHVQNHFRGNFPNPPPILAYPQISHISYNAFPQTLTNDTHTHLPWFRYPIQSRTLEWMNHLALMHQTMSMH